MSPEHIHRRSLNACARKVRYSPEEAAAVWHRYKDSDTRMYVCDHCGGWIHFGHEPVWEREAKKVQTMKPFIVREHKLRGPRRVFLSRDEINRLCSVAAERVRA